MHQVRNLSSDHLRESYRVGATIFDAWYHEQDEHGTPGLRANVYIETIVSPESTIDDDCTYYDGDERLTTYNLNRIEIPISSWEEFLANPESYLMEALL